jgi:hypothetical protein
MLHTRLLFAAWVKIKEWLFENRETALQIGMDTDGCDGMAEGRQKFGFLYTVEHDCYNTSITRNIETI